MEKTAQEIFTLLKSTVINQVGRIVFSLGDTTVTMKTTDTVGNSLQSWLQQWFLDNDIYESEPTNTQEFPDFYLSESNPKDNMLEVKAFNYNASPAFDIANYESYVSSVAEKPYRLNADYLIFGYTMADGDITIKKLWLKKIWEIAGRGKRYPLNTQVKRNVIYNIRPSSSFKNGLPSVFSSKEDFLKAVYETQKMYRGENNANDWLEKLKTNFRNYYHTTLEI
ncbi:MAG: NgoBV family restriction endonuclease [Clostridiales bacterium]|nr:NgoBV family restriction endonuclease [Clostridiales bacterium]